MVRAVDNLEKEHFFSGASFSQNYKSQEVEPFDYRLPYKRNVDRILHSKAYSRYVDKTQVVYLIENDHVTHRSLHVQLVSSFARGIGQKLRLNTDLIEAIALGHDVGHPPFGHEGEGYLSLLSQEQHNDFFSHPLQSCRLLTEIEPLNLGLAVYDGILCHDGGMSSPVLTPQFDKTWQNHFDECMLKKKDPNLNILPMSLEGCLVKLCDTLSYVGKDIEDAIDLAIIDRKDVPKTVLGIYNRDILNYMATDIISHSQNKNVIAFSEHAFEALKQLRRFNFEAIYSHPKLKVESLKIKQCYRLLFDWFLNDLRTKHQMSYVWTHFVAKRKEKYRLETKDVQMVIDYIAGMTDSFFIRTFEKLFVPSTIFLGK